MALFDGDIGDADIPQASLLYQAASQLQDIPANVTGEDLLDLVGDVTGELEEAASMLNEMCKELVS